MVIVPYEELQPDTVRRLIEEFVTRHGAVHGQADESIERNIERVLGQLKAGLAVVAFDEASESCTVVLKTDLPKDRMQ